MKIRRPIIGLVIVAALLLALALWFGKRKSDELPSDVAQSTIAATSRTPSASLQSNAPATQVASNTPPPKTKAEQMKEGLAALNDEDVVFYGKVLDQFGLPVTNAKVAGSVQVNNGTLAGVDKFSLVTDENGLFNISGYKGKTLGIWITKDGYVMAMAKTSFVFSRLWPESERYVSVPNNPTVIKMWKLQGTQPLTGINQRYKFHFTGAPMHFDLLGGKIVSSGGDILITITRSQGVVSERILQDWGVQIEAVDGGLIQVSASESRVIYELPEGGYQPAYSYLMSTNAHSWHGAVNQTFFLRTRNGQLFSKVNIGVSINQQPDDYVWVEIHGELNPSGSRNFEADANAMAMKPQ